MIALLDVNVLVALLDANHIHHQGAQIWFNKQIEFGWATCPITQNGCIRVLSAMAAKNAIDNNLRVPVAPGQIAARLKKATEHQSHQFVSDDLSLLTSGVVNFDFIHGHRQITDIYLLALAREHQMVLASFDSSIVVSAVVGARAEHLLNPAASI